MSQPQDETPDVAGAYQAHAAQAVGDVQQPDLGVDAGPTMEEIQAQAVRAALSDFEKQLAATMAQAQAQFSQQQATIDALTRQLATVRAQAGPPVAQLLADSLATRVANIAIANPDLPATHFTGVIGQAQSLAEEVKAVAGGTGSSSRVEQLASGITAWFSRAHPRVSSKVLEGMHAALDEAERIVEELPQLVPAAVAITKAL